MSNEEIKIRFIEYYKKLNRFYSKIAIFCIIPIPILLTFGCRNQIQDIQTFFILLSHNILISIFPCIFAIAIFANSFTPEIRYLKNRDVTFTKGICQYGPIRKTARNEFIHFTIPGETKLLRYMAYGDREFNKHLPKRGDTVYVYKKGKHYEGFTLEQLTTLLY